MEGDPKFNASQHIPNVPYHKFAELIGLKGIYVDDPNRVGAAWEEALAADRPTVVEFKTDPDVPPLPPHITLKQAKGFASSLIAGDPEEGSVILGTARQVLASVLPGKGEQMIGAEARIGRVAASAYEIPTDAPEADGTLAWNSTALVVVEIEAGSSTGLGYTYRTRRSSR